ncbi:MAG: GDSL-type esterase/lipase family protein [Bacteroidota bacterium]
MYRFLLFVSLIVFPVGASRALPEAIAESSLPDSLRIVVIGSSTAAGYRASVQDSAWVWRYRSELEAINSAYEVVNLSVKGYSSYQLQPSDFVAPSGRPHVDTGHNITRALALHPSAVILNLPSNDASSNYSILEQSDNFERIAEAATNARVPLWVCTTQPRDLSGAKRQNLITMRDWIRNRFAGFTLDFWTGIALEDGSLDPLLDSGDGIHPNDQGHAILFARVRDAAIPERLEQINWVAAVPPSTFEIAVFPNPSHDAATLRLRLESAGTLHISVNDMLGRTVLRETDRFAPAGVVFARLDLAALPAGMYVCVAESPTGTAMQRLLITR